MKHSNFYLNVLGFLGKNDKIISLFEDGELDENNSGIIYRVAESYVIQFEKDKIDEYLLRSRVAIESYIRENHRVDKKLLQLYNKVIYIFENTLSKQKKAELNAQLLSMRSVKSSKAWLILSSNYDAADNPDLAINYLKQAVWNNPKCITAYYKLGYIYEKNLCKKDAAIYYYKKAVLLNPEDDEYEGIKTNSKYIQMACQQLGKILFEEKNYKPVTLLLEKALSLVQYTGSSSNSIIRDLIDIAIKSSENMGIKDKFIMRLVKIYGFDEDLLQSYTATI